MKSEHVLRREKIDNRIQKAYEVFLNHGHDQSVTDKKIEAFLSGTEGMKGFAGEEMCRSDRLSLLSEKCIELGWDAVCAVSEFMVRNEPLDEQRLSWVVWYQIGFSCFVESSKVAFEERCRVAEDMFRVLNNLLNLSAKDPLVAYTFGRLYLTHPLHQKDEQKYLEKALECFLAAERWSIDAESEQQAYEALSALADTYFRLEQWRDALESYRRLKTVRRALSLTSVGDEIDLNIDSRIAECERKLLS